MANPRKLITAAVAVYLATPPDPSAPTVFLTDAKRRVTDTDGTPPDVDELPEINVVFAREDIDASTQHEDGHPGLKSPKRRVMEMRVECYHTAGKDAADDVAWQVEEALRAKPTLDDSVESLRLKSVDLYVVENATLALYAAVMVYEVAYWTHLIEAENGIPRTVLLGFEPQTGPGNEPDYSEILGE